MTPRGRALQVFQLVSKSSWPALIVVASIVALGLAVAMASAQPSNQTDGSDGKSAAGKSAAGEPAGEAFQTRADSRIREGTELVDQAGHFRLTGDRVTFFSEGSKGRFVVLENLNLERVARMIAENPDYLKWSVTATVTEYRGANYVFIRKAVLRNRRESAEGEFNL